jgi:hypothetical protein
LQTADSAASNPLSRGVRAYEPQLALGGSGAATVAFDGSLGSDRRGILIAMRDTSGRWRRARPIGGGSKLSGNELRLARDARGESILAWSQRETHRVQVFVLNAAGTLEGFLGPVRLSAQKDIEPVAAIAPDGTATVLFADVLGAHTTTLEFADHVADGRWSRPQRLTAPARTFTEPQLAADSRGELMALWTEKPQGAIEATTRASGGAWGAPVRISPEGASSPSLSLSSNGKATAAWVTYRAASRLETADYEPGGA